jgi:hypothetical protein
MKLQISTFYSTNLSRISIDYSVENQKKRIKALPLTAQFAPRW